MRMCVCVCVSWVMCKCVSYYVLRSKNIESMILYIPFHFEIRNMYFQPSYATLRVGNEKKNFSF